MKSVTILKDELTLLNADKSAVVTELRVLGDKLVELEHKIDEAEIELRDIRQEILDDSARLNDLRSRAVSVSTDLSRKTQDYKNANSAYDSVKVKNSQEVKLHLGRIKELREEEQMLTKEINQLKVLYDKNADIFAQHMSDKQSIERETDSNIKLKQSELAKIEKAVTDLREEEKKILKDRLKREDKLRARERVVEIRENALLKREEDIETASKDIIIVYNRLKLLYAEVKPEVDLDKLIMQV